MQGKLNLRFANISDARGLADIYRYYVENTAVSFEYTPPDENEFAERIREKLSRYPFILAEIDGEIVGYAYASRFLPRPAYCHSVETTVYLKHGLTGQGIGKLLYNALEEILKIQNVLSANACIAVTSCPDTTLNNNSMLFHSRMGYRYVGRFNASGYKFDRFYDMIWMEKLLTAPSEPFPDFVPFPEVLQKASSILKDFSV